MGIKLNKDPLAVKQSNYSTKIVNFYILYDLDAWLRTSTNNFKFKNGFFGETSLDIMIKKSRYIMAMKYHLMGQVHGILIRKMLGVL